MRSINENYPSFQTMDFGDGHATGQGSQHGVGWGKGKSHSDNNSPAATDSTGFGRGHAMGHGVKKEEMTEGAG